MKSDEWFMYVVECSDGTLYTGITTNLERRIHEHNHTPRAAKYTIRRRPVKLIYFLPIGSRSDALKEEYKFKQLSRKQQLRIIHEGG